MDCYFRFDRLLMFLLVGSITLNFFGCTTVQQKVQELSPPNNAEVPPPSEKLTLGSFESLGGTPFMLAPVSIEPDYRYSSSTGANVYNFYFVDTNTLTGRRLVPKNNWRFLQSDKLGTFDKNGALIKTQGLWFVVIKNDSNGDRQLSDRDQQTIAICDEAGKNYTEIISQVDRVLGSYRKGNSRLQVLYRAKGKNLITEIDVETRRAVKTSALPAIQ